MTKLRRSDAAASFRLVPWLTIDIDVDTIGLGPRLFLFNVPGTIRLFVNLSVKVFGFTVLFGHIEIV